MGDTVERQGRAARPLVPTPAPGQDEGLIAGHDPGDVTMSSGTFRLHTIPHAVPHLSVVPS
jgi:hypothetical protein